MMELLRFVFFVSFVVFCPFVRGQIGITTQGPSTDGESAKIGGGQIALSGQFPYHIFVIFLQDGKTKLCEGAIIAEDYALTAATCSINVKSPSDIYIGAGTTVVTRDPPTILRNVTDIWIHPMFQLYNSIADISVLKLEEKLDLSGERMKSIGLQTNPDMNPGTRCTISGYGATSWNEEVIDKNLRSVEVPVIGNEECYRLWSRTIRDGNICAGDIQGTTGPFESDIGGPLVCDGLLTGIVSTIAEDKPAIYTEISYYKPWIMEKMGRSPRDNNSATSFNNVHHVTFGVMFVVIIMYSKS